MRDTGLRDKVVIVTGGAAGLGHATARRFAEEGCRVAVWDVNEPAAPPPIIAPAPPHAARIFSRVDVADRASVESGLAQRDEPVGTGRHPRQQRRHPARRATREMEGRHRWPRRCPTRDFDAVMGVNLRGVFLCTRAVVPHMIAAGGGVVLNASSVVGPLRQLRADQLCGRQSRRDQHDAHVGPRAREIQHPRQRSRARLHCH